MIDLTTIPTGGDVQAAQLENAEAAIASLQNSLAYMQDRAQEYADDRDKARRQVLALGNREIRILQRYVRKRAAIEKRWEWRLAMLAGGAVVVPLFIVAVSLAWRLAVWAVAT